MGMAPTATERVVVKRVGPVRRRRLRTLGSGQRHNSKAPTSSVGPHAHENATARQSCGHLSHRRTRRERCQRRNARSLCCARATASYATTQSIILPQFSERALIQFIEENGGSVPRESVAIRDKRNRDVPLRVGGGGSIVSCNRHYVVAGDEDRLKSVNVPRQCWMEASKDWRYASLVEEYGNQGYDNDSVSCLQRPWVLLALRLLDEIRLCDKSRFAPYLATLQFGDTTPHGRVPPCCTYLYEDFYQLETREIEDDCSSGNDDDKIESSERGIVEQLNLMNESGMQFAQTCMEYRGFVESIWNRLADEENGLIGIHRDVFSEEFFNFTKFMWAFGVLRCRTFGPLQGDNIALVPLLDLAAHDPYASSWQLKKGGLLGGKEGMELLLGASDSNYDGSDRIISMRFDSPEAPKTTSQMGLDYGVVEDVSTRSQRSGYQLTLGLDENDPNYDDKLDIVEMEGLGASVNFFLPAEIGSEPPDGMLQYLRLMSLGGADAFLLESIFRDKVWTFLQLPISEQNEGDMCRSMIEGSKEALSLFPKAENLDSRQAGGSILEASLTAEKCAILSILEWFEMQSESLGQLLYYQERRLQDLNLIDDEGKSTYDPFDDMTIA